MTNRTHEVFSSGEEVRGSSDRTFGLFFAAVSLVIGLWPLRHGLSARPSWLWLVAALVLAALAILRPALLATPNRLWLKLGLLLARVVNPIVLGVLFFAIFTPFGLAKRLFAARTGIRTTIDRDAGTYWIERPPGPPPESMRLQY